MKTGDLSLKTVAGQTALSVSTLGLSLVFPQIFHYFGLGQDFLPMLFPVVIVSFFTRRWSVTVLPALAAPFLSALLFGMPSVRVSFALAGEMIVLSGFLLNLKKQPIPLLIAWPAVIILGRVVSLSVLAVAGMITGGLSWPDAAAFSLLGWKGSAVLLMLGFVMAPLARLSAKNEM